jgi:hypothetical protein
MGNRQLVIRARSKLAIFGVLEPDLAILVVVYILLLRGL